MAARPERRATRKIDSRALTGSALFVSACLALAAVPAAATDCPPDRLDERARVARAFDGDTLQLSDGRKVRLIGINAPETARGARPAEAGAVAARNALRTLLARSEGEISLRFDAERHDRYGRLLAHAFGRDGRNLHAELLRDGHAAAIAVPPNLWHRDCYARLAAAARERGTGIWTLARYRGTAVADLDPRAGGFWTLEGRVREVRRNRGTTWIELGRGLSLRLGKDDLVHFAGVAPESWRGRRVRVSGWISTRRGDQRMGLRHPSQLEIIR